MLTSFHSFFVCVALVLYLSVIWGRADEFPRGQYCGPHAVREALEMLNDYVDLPELIHEMQPDARSLSSFLSLRNALTKRGAHVVALRLGNGAVPEFDGPIIVRIDRGLGHFAVAKRICKSANCPIFEINTLDGYVRRTQWPDLSRKLSADLLLVSNSELGNPLHFRRAKQSIAIIAMGKALVSQVCFTMVRKRLGKKVGRREIIVRS